MFSVHAGMNLGDLKMQYQLIDVKCPVNCSLCMTSIFQSMQRDISEQLTKVCKKIDDISERIDSLEDRQISFEKQSSQSMSPAVPGKRKRVTPTVL